MLKDEHSNLVTGSYSDGLYFANILNKPEVLIVNERVSIMYNEVILTLENGNINRVKNYKKRKEARIIS